MRRFQSPGSSYRFHLLSSLSAAVLVAAAPALAGNPHPVDIPAGPLQAALAALATQTGEQLVYTPALVAGRQAPALVGRYDFDTALARLLAGGDIEATRAGPRITVLRKREATAAAPAAGGEQPETAKRPFDRDPLPAAGSPAAAGEAAPPKSQTASAATTVEEVEVTGTHIHGGTTASPVVTLDRIELERTGQMTVAQGLATVPQNFNGLDTEVSNVTRADGHGINGAFATGVNLRGLGSNATLVLVDGRRLGGAGAKGDFTDISTLPNIAISSVDLLLDGASAIYGSDAVGGVVNVRMRNGLDGGEIRVEGGWATDGRPSEGQAGMIVGHTWTGGGIVGAYEAYHRTRLLDADRAFAASPDLRPFGGSDFRTPFSHPGTILGAIGGPAGATFAIPAGQDGLHLTPASFTPGVNLGNSHLGADLLPDQERQSAYLAAHQTLGRLTLEADAIYGFRAARFTLPPPSSAFSVSRANPFFVSPTGGTSEFVEYAFSGDLPPPVSRGTEESLAVTLSAKADLGHRWRSDSFADFAQDIEESHTAGMVNSTILAEALGNVPDQPTTAYSPARDGFFNPFTGIVANPRSVLDAIGSGFSVTRGVSRTYTASTQLDGPLVDLPAGPLSLAIGGQVRRETFRRGGSNYTSTVAPTPISGTDVSRTVGGLYAELRAPLFGPDNARPGLQRLELTAALRWEHYSDFGGTTNPKVGVIWSPVDGVQARLTYGRSFRAPALRELRDPAFNTPVFSSVNGVRVLSLLLTGGNANLQPETAETWTAGVDWRPSSVPGLQVSGTFFDVAYDHRIDQPVISSISTALGDPTLASFVRRLDPTNAADLAAITALLSSPATSTAQGSFPPASYGGILDGRYVNTGALEVRGLDLSIAYGFGVAGGRLDLSATGSDLLEYRQQLTPTGPLIGRVGLVNFPVRLRARLNADWTRGPLSVGASVNHMSGEHDTVGHGLDPQTSLDLRLRWTAPEASHWRGLSASVTARNVFDQTPPFYNNPLGFGFDGANAEVIGRFVSIQLAKSW